MSSQATTKQSTAREETPVGSPCWIEIMSVDPPKLKRFYASLFPAWQFKPESEEYKENDICMYEFTQPSGLSGGILKLPEGCPRSNEQPMGIGMTVYYFAPSIDEIEKKIHELGGTTVLGKTPQGKNGWFANFKDPEGNRFGTYEAHWEDCKKD